LWALAFIANAAEFKSETKYKLLKLKYSKKKFPCKEIATTNSFNGNFLFLSF
jgi:hypothetical protein